MIRDPSDGSTKSAPPPCGSLPSGECVPPVTANTGGADTRNSYAALKAKHGETWGIKQPERLPKAPFKAMTAEQLAEHYARHNLGFERKRDSPHQNVTDRSSITVDDAPRASKPNHHGD